MKLNNKGFAISTIMYMILIMAVILIVLTLTLLGSRKLILDKAKQEAIGRINDESGTSYRDILETLKSEALVYASENNVQKESIKISNLNSSIDSKVLDRYKLSEKYLTMVRNEETHDVYLGNEKKITENNKFAGQILDILDYKIFGNSIQNGTPTPKIPVEIESVGNTTKNLINFFDISTQQKILNKDSYLLDLEAGKKYTLSFSFKDDNKIGSYFYFYKFDGETKTFLSYLTTGEIVNPEYTFTAEEGYQYLICRGGSYAMPQSELNKFETFQVEEGIYATEYVPYHDKYTIPIIVKSRNLISIPDLVGEIEGKNVSYFTNFKLEANKTYTLSADIETSQNPFELNVGVGDANYFRETIKKQTFKENGRVSITFTPTEEMLATYNKLYVIFITANSSTTPYSYSVKNVQLEEGSVANPYTPYVEPIETNIYLNEPIRKVGDYQDEIISSNTKLNRLILAKNLSGLTWSVNGSGDTMFYYYTVPNNRIEGSSIRSNMFSVYAVTNSNKGTGIVLAGTNIVRVRPNLQEFQTVNDWNEFLKTNDMWIYYVPKEIDSSTEADLPKINFNLNSTIISVNTKTQPSSLEFTVIEKIRQL